MPPRPPPRPAFGSRGSTGSVPTIAQTIQMELEQQAIAREIARQRELRRLARLAQNQADRLKRMSEGSKKPERKS